jgi:hypothetical protein
VPGQSRSLTALVPEHYPELVPVLFRFGEEGSRRLPVPGEAGPVQIILGIGAHCGLDLEPDQGRWRGPPPQHQGGVRAGPYPVATRAPEGSRVEELPTRPERLGQPADLGGIGVEAVALAGGQVAGRSPCEESCQGETPGRPDRPSPARGARSGPWRGHSVGPPPPRPWRYARHWGTSARWPGRSPRGQQWPLRRARKLPGEL